jgi:polyhydroxyalkanoate synthesis regulator phasin
MDKMTKKGLEIGLGVAAITMAAVNDIMTELEKQGKVSRKDGEKMVRDMAKKYRSEGAKYAKKAEKQMDALMKKYPVVTQKDIEDIYAQIEKINKEISKKKGRK